MPEALQTIVDLMRSAKSEKVRLDAPTTLLALAGVRPADGVEEEKPSDGEQQRPAVLLNLFLGGGEGQAREAGAPVQLAGEEMGRSRNQVRGGRDAVPGVIARGQKEKRPGCAGAFL